MKKTLTRGTNYKVLAAIELYTTGTRERTLGTTRRRQKCIMVDC